MTGNLRSAVDRSLFLPLGAVLALAWANTEATSYFTVANHLSFAVNDVGMALFMALTMFEVIETGPPRLVLRDWRLVMLAVIAAVGGIVGAGLTYVGYLQLGDEAPLLASGWPIVCATDIAFVCFIARRMCAPPAIGFLLLVAIVSDAVGLLVVELRYPIGDLHPAGALLIVAAIVAAFALRWRGVRSAWPYLLGCGALSWCGLFLTGVHPALALLPIVPFLNRDRFCRTWDAPARIVLFMFGLTNAGVIVRSVGTGTWAVALAAAAGRPAGMLLALALAAAAGLRMPRSFGWRDMVVVAAASGVGFAFALFFATLTFAVGPVLNELKLGALLTIALSLPALAAARMLHVGRFARPVARPLTRPVSPRGTQTPGLAGM
jgi:NhaA family Na+:H+ antiporter